ncbi:MAG: cytochrome c biogenesis heme-transporting ATPase CcmA [Gammaproteobacteria bacterium]|nr:cytochrome c biogenesis heme-transporting ATPase CcmA [Gammaproteobacteria bacterium]
MLEARDLAALRGDRRLFSGLDFAVEAGDLLQVAGHNGSGKTTLLRMLAGLIVPEQGMILWQGQPLRTQREDYARDLFYFGHLPGLKDEFNGVENLRFASELAGTLVTAGEAAGALARFGLEGFEDLPAKVLSQGQKRRVALARLLLSEARLWVLDEPFTALDVSAIDVLRAILQQHLVRGGMLVMTSHQDVAVTHSGRVKQLRLGR